MAEVKNKDEVEDVQVLGDESIKEKVQNPGLIKIIEAESTNFQWKKLGLNILNIFTLVVISLLRGPGDDSIIGVKRCDGIDWLLFCIL